MIVGKFECHGYGVRDDAILRKRIVIAAIEVTVGVFQALQVGKSRPSAFAASPMIAGRSEKEGPVKANAPTCLPLFSSVRPICSRS